MWALTEKILLLKGKIIEARAGEGDGHRAGGWRKGRRVNG